MSPPQSALIFGATGRTGRRILTELLSPASGFNRVGEYGRRVTPTKSEELGRPVLDHSKLEQKVIDFEKLGDSGIGIGDGKWDVVFITLGTTRAASNTRKQYEKIDKDYVLKAAKAARSSDPSFKQRLVYLSAIGANSKSWFFYPRCKGETEVGLASLGYTDVIFFHPGFLDGEPQSSIESYFAPIAYAISLVFSRFDIPIPLLGKAMFKAGKVGSQGIPPECELQEGGSPEHPYTILNNAAAITLANAME